MKISVALAAYKGEKYIEQQLRSILMQLCSDDEIIVSDDLPSDEMKNIIAKISDNRIKYVQGPGQGVIKNFENAISLCSGDYIFLCDQDDVWLENKANSCVRELEKGNILVLHDAKVVDAYLNVIEKSFFNLHGIRTGIIGNIIKNSFVGCCMAFKKELKNHILPFPEKIPMHDQWIGLTALKKGNVKFLNKQLILYRRHSETFTGKKTSFSEKIKWRYQIIKSFIQKPNFGGREWKK